MNGDDLRLAADPRNEARFLASLRFAHTPLPGTSTYVFSFCPERPIAVPMPAMAGLGFTADTAR